VKHLNKADRALLSARLLLRDGDTDGAVNRVYYAMFDAARAALTASVPGLPPASIRTHRGLIAAFGEHLVKTHRMEIDLGRSLNQVERIRLLADYTGEPIESAKAAWAIDQAGTFLEHVARLIGGAPETPDRATPEP
jgi:uncharacterized protein (UPF0332 family)